MPQISGKHFPPNNWYLKGFFPSRCEQREALFDCIEGFEFLLSFSDKRASNKNTCYPSFFMYFIYICYCNYTGYNLFYSYLVLTLTNRNFCLILELRNILVKSFFKDDEWIAFVYSSEAAGEPFHSALTSVERGISDRSSAWTRGSLLGCLSK